MKCTWQHCNPLTVPAFEKRVSLLVTRNTRGSFLGTEAKRLIAPQLHQTWVHKFGRMGASLCGDETCIRHALLCADETYRAHRKICIGWLNISLWTHRCTTENISILQQSSSQCPIIWLIHKSGTIFKSCVQLFVKLVLKCNRKQCGLSHRNIHWME